MALPTLETPSFLGGLGKGLGSGLERSTQTIQSLILNRQKEKQRQSFTESSIKRLPSYLKEFYPSYYENPQVKRQLAELVKNYPDLPDSEAIESAIREYRAPKTTSTRDSFQTTPQANVEGQPETMRDFLSNILSRSQQTLAPEHPMTTLERERPGGTLASLGLGAVSPIEEIARGQSKAGREFMESLGFTYPEGSEKGPLVTEQLRERLHRGLSPEAIRATQFPEMVGAFLPIERLLGGLQAIGKSTGFLRNAEKIAAREGIEAGEAAQRILQQAESAGINLEKAAAGDRQEAGKLFNLSNRISRGAPQTATEMRVARAEPKSKMFPSEERMATRESQLKAFPKYEAEIAQDASERAARAEAKIPKTVKGMDARRLRIHEAEKNLPAAEEGYRKAIARVRALEDQTATMKGSKETAKGLLEAAKNELKDAEFSLRQTRQNIEGGEARKGLEDMRKAAQEKMLKISDQIAAGEEVKLAKMDYNPEMIRQAKQIEKKKPLPAVKQDDFYQQVHKEYGDQYRNQLSRIEKELKEVPKTMAQAERIRNLQKEKDVLKKLIDQTEAERTIHRHKLALRETAERQKARERLGQFERQQAQPKVQKVASERIQEAIRNPTGKATEDLINEAANSTKNVQQKEKIIEQKGSFQDALNQIKRKTEELKSGGSPKTTKAAHQKGIKIAGDISEIIQAYKRGPLQIFKTKIGHDILLGIGAQLLTEVAHEYDLDVPQTAIISALIGSPRGAGYRYLVGWATRSFINAHKKNQYIEAIRSGDDKKVAELRSKYPSKLIKEAREQLQAG